MSGFYDTLIKSYEYATCYKNLANPTSTIEIYQKTVNYHASTKKKYKKGSHLLFQNKPIQKEYCIGPRIATNILKQKTAYKTMKLLRLNTKKIKESILQ